MTVLKWTCRILLAALLAGGAAARAAEVSAELSQATAQVGEEVTLTLRVSGARESGRPLFPAVDGLRIELDPTPVQRSDQLLYNGRLLRRNEIVWTLRITPLVAGRLTLPACRVQADGETHTTDPQTLFVSRGEGGAPLIVEVETDRDSAYVEEPVRATLRVWIRAFRFEGRTLSASQMWSLLDKRASTFGPFQEPAYVEQRAREDESGRAASYYVYEDASVVWPETPGPLRLGDVSLAINYPVSLVRDIFGELRLQRHRRIEASPGEIRLNVRPIPDENRPDGFTGAVGEYRIAASAAPTQVSVGDPITLTLRIRGTGRLDRLAAPQLTAIPDLTRDFKVPEEALAGSVEGDTKTFTQTIRATRADVRAIPPITLHAFNPRTEQFETIASEPIPITVRAVETLPLSQVIEASPGAPRAPRELVARTEGLLANHADAATALLDQRIAFGPGWAALLLGCPAAYLGLFFVRRHGERYATDRAYRRRRSAASAARDRLAAARGASPAAASESATAALCGFVADWFDLPAGALTRSEAIRALAERGVAADVVAELDGVLAEMELSRYGGASAAGDPAAQAGACLERLERALR